MAQNLPKIPIQAIIGAVGVTGTLAGVGYLGWNSVYSGAWQSVLFYISPRPSSVPGLACGCMHTQCPVQAFTFSTYASTLTLHPTPTPHPTPQ